MRIAYIAHPISGNIEDNLKRIADISREINLTEPDVVPFAPYFLDINSLDDDIPSERERGIRNDTELLSRGFVDEMRLYGDRISMGMMHEVILAERLGIKIIPMTDETKNDLEFYNKTK